MATALIIESNGIGGDGQGNTAQAVLVTRDANAPSASTTHNLTYAGTAATTVPFKPDTRMVSIGMDGTKGFIKFGKEGVEAGKESGEFDGWQPANTLVSYIVDVRYVDRVAVYDGSS